MQQDLELDDCCKMCHELGISFHTFKAIKETFEEFNFSDIGIGNDTIMMYIERFIENGARFKLD